MDNIAAIKRIKASIEKGLLDFHNVTGVGIGEKIKDGERTNIICIRVYVKQKLSKSKVPDGQMIPSDFNGIQTDVIEREFVIQTARVKEETLKLMTDSGTYDALTGGISIGPCRPIFDANGQRVVSAGTLGLVVQDNSSSERMMLSNFHVMCDVDNNWAPGDTMAQPGQTDGGRCPASIVGNLTRASLGGQVDCAVSTITNRQHNCQVIEIGNIKGTAIPVLNEQVRKRGRTTKLTYGFVEDISATIRVDFEGNIGIITLSNQIGIESDSSQNLSFSKGGDSGSVIVNVKNEVTGLLFAGSIERRDAQGTIIEPEGRFTYANPIDAVFSALNISLCTKPLYEFTSPSADRVVETLLEHINLTYPFGENLTLASNDVIKNPSGYDTIREGIGSITFPPRFDEIKNPSGYDTIQEGPGGYTFREETGFTFQEGMPNVPDVPPFALSTPHHASGAARFETPSSIQQGNQQTSDIDTEIVRVSEYLNLLLTQRRNKGQ